MQEGRTSSGIRRCAGNTNASTANRHDRSWQIQTMPGQQIRHQINPRGSGDIRQPNDARVAAPNRYINVPESLSIVTRIRRSSAAHRSRAASPGSGSSSQEVRTSWPSTCSHAARRRPAHRSTRNFKCGSRPRRRADRWPAPHERRPGMRGCPPAASRDNRP